MIANKIIKLFLLSVLLINAGSFAETSKILNAAKNDRCMYYVAGSERFRVGCPCFFKKKHKCKDGITASVDFSVIKSDDEEILNTKWTTKMEKGFNLKGDTKYFYYEKDGVGYAVSYSSDMKCRGGDFCQTLNLQAKFKLGLVNGVWGQKFSLEIEDVVYAIEHSDDEFSDYMSLKMMGDALGNQKDVGNAMLNLFGLALLNQQESSLKQVCVDE